MKQCTACDRHLFGEEPSCPFCGAEQRTTSATIPIVGPIVGPNTGPLGSMLASVTLALGLCVAACGPTVEVETPDASSSSDTGPSATTIGTTTTAGITTDDGPSMTTIASTSTSADADSSDDAPCAFYACRPDVGSNPDPLECDPFEQDCPPGEKCVPWADDGGTSVNATRCSPIADNPGQAGDLCTVEGSPVSGIDDCDLGLLCFDVDQATLQGTCVTQCTGSEQNPLCPEPEQVCWTSNNGALGVCLQGCNPLIGDCPEGTGCLSDGDPFACFPTTGEGVYNDNCQALNDCAPGFVCEGALPFCAGSCCTSFCDLTMPDCPNALQGVACEAWFTAGTAPPGFENVGFCDW